MKNNCDYYIPIQKESLILDDGYREYEPSMDLRPYIACFWESVRKCNSIAVETKVKRVIPDGCTDIIFYTDDIDKPFKGEVCGAMDRAVILQSDNTYKRNFGIRFFPGYAYLFLGIPLIEIKNGFVDLELVWKNDTKEIEELISESKSTLEIIHVLENQLRKILYGNESLNFNLLNILSRIYESKGNIRLKEIASKEIISQRQIHRNFSNYIGLNPKSFIKVVRLQNIYNKVLRTPQQNIFNSALDYGYYDQSHFIKDFKKFYGDTPSRIF